METLLTPTAEPVSGHHLRAFNPVSDLNAVADLVELCFANTLDADGHRYLRQMRAAARNPNLVRLAGRLGDASSFPMFGYVWEENGRLIGNLSLVPFRYRGQRLYMIANVAVHPDFRRRGVARALTEKSLEHLEQVGAGYPWLQVRDDNPSAFDLYASLGFQEQFRRTTWHSQHGSPPPLAPPPDYRIIPLAGKDRKLQQRWLKNAYPTAMEWYLPFRLRDLRPDFLGMVLRLFGGIFVRQWAAEHANQLVGTAAWQATQGSYNAVWLGLKPELEENAGHALLVFLLQKYGLRRAITVDYPAGRLIESFKNCGFTAQHTLIWMRGTRWK
ncbi:MAG: GNAT family N-acetyltransferase [Anaerolineales bacterium]|jgi:GNAT superfamily N-acetyltransferase